MPDTNIFYCSFIMHAQVLDQKIWESKQLTQCNYNPEHRTWAIGELPEHRAERGPFDRLVGQTHADEAGQFRGLRLDQAPLLLVELLFLFRGDKEFGDASGMKPKAHRAGISICTCWGRESGTSSSTNFGCRDNMYFDSANLWILQYDIKKKNCLVATFIVV